MITINEYDYGGAYDIDPEMYFTKDDLLEFANEIIDNLYADYDVDFDLADIFIDDNNELYISIDINNDYTINSSVYIDMRRIRKPEDIYKYETDILDELSTQINEYIEFYSDALDESETVEIFESGDFDEYKKEYIEENEPIYENNKEVLSIKEENDTPDSAETDETDNTEDEDDKELLEALKLGDPWPDWTDAYKVFAFIQKMYSGKIDVINQKVKEFYDMFKGVKSVDKAYQRWCSQE